MQADLPKADHPKRKPRWLRFGLRSVLVAVPVAIVTGLGYLAYSVYDVVHVVVPNCYAQEWVATLVIEYMKENGGRWPRGWHDLAKPYQVLSREREIPWPLDDLQARVEVRFDVDRETLRSAVAIAEQPPIQVIRLRNGGLYHWQGSEPNRIVWDYLNKAPK